MQGLVHTVLGGANIGVLVLATGAFVFRLLLGARVSDGGRTADLIAFYAAMVGFGIALFSSLSGYFTTWSMAAIQDTLLAQNKVLVSLALLGSWGMFIYLRWRTGPRLWQSVSLRIWSSVLVAIGFVNTVLAGSMGGSASLKGTILDPILWTLNINRYISLAWTVWINVALIVVSLALIIWATTRRRRAEPVRPRAD